jgi:hypothetical protein
MKVTINFVGGPPLILRGMRDDQARTLLEKLGDLPDGATMITGDNGAPNFTVRRGQVTYAEATAE